MLTKSDKWNDKEKNFTPFFKGFSRRNLINVEHANNKIVMRLAPSSIDGLKR